MRHCSFVRFAQWPHSTCGVLLIQLEFSVTLPGANVLNKPSTGHWMFGGHSFWNSFRWCVSCVITVSTKSSYVYTRHNVCKTDIITLVSFGEKKKITCINRNIFGRVLCGNRFFFFFLIKKEMPKMLCQHCSKQSFTSAFQKLIKRMWTVSAVSRIPLYFV